MFFVKNCLSFKEKNLHTGSLLYNYSIFLQIKMQEYEFLL